MLVERARAASGGRGRPRRSARRARAWPAPTPGRPPWRPRRRACAGCRPSRSPRSAPGRSSGRSRRRAPRGARARRTGRPRSPSGGWCGAVEDGLVVEQPAGDPLEPLGAGLVREPAEALRGQARVAAADEHEVALDDAVREGPGRDQAGLELLGRARARPSAVAVVKIFMFEAIWKRVEAAAARTASAPVSGSPTQAPPVPPLRRRCRGEPALQVAAPRPPLWACGPPRRPAS